MPIKIGERIFNSKKQAISFFSEMLKKYNISEKVDSQDEVFLLSLLRNHPNFLLKKGNGINYIYVAPDGYGKKCFFIMRIDGTYIDFSFYACINGGKSAQNKFDIACRDSVKDYIIDFAEKNNKKDNEHVDHIPPLTFSKIVDDFIEKEDIDLYSIVFDESETGVRFFDNELKQSFFEYHKSVCQLRIILAKDNLKTSYKGRRKHGIE